MNNDYLDTAAKQAALNELYIATTSAPMPTSFVEFTESTRMVFEREDQSGQVFAYFQGKWGRQLLDYDFHNNKTLVECMASSNCVAQSIDTMTALNENQETARFFYTMIQEQGLVASLNQLRELGVMLLVTVGGESLCVDWMHQCIYQYDVISDSLFKMYYSRHRDWAHFQLSLAGDAVAFRHRAPTESRVLGHVWVARLIRELAAKRLFEIYRADQSKEHLAWVCDHVFAGDLGL